MIFSIIIGILLYIICLFFIAMKLKDNSIVDIGWGIGFIIITVISLFSGSEIYLHQVLLSTLVIIWGIRLALHIFVRNKGKGEDFRYKKWREEWGNNFVIRSFFQVFMLQGFLMLIISIPIVVVNTSYNQSFSFIDFLGFITWLTGFLFQSVSDFQLLKFKKDSRNKGKIMKNGLWKYSRHPNYFGEALMWWGVYLISIESGYYYFSIISPITITFLLLKVSGVPMLEAKYKGNSEYEKYIRQTNSFIAWFPRK